MFHEHQKKRVSTDQWGHEAKKEKKKVNSFFQDLDNSQASLLYWYLMCNTSESSTHVINFYELPCSLIIFNRQQVIMTCSARQKERNRLDCSVWMTMSTNAWPLKVQRFNIRTRISDTFLVINLVLVYWLPISHIKESD